MLRRVFPGEPLYSVAAVRALEQAAIFSGVDEFTLMTRAGHAAFRWLERRLPSSTRVTIVCGSGNNGGDGFVLATFLHRAKHRVRVLLAPSEKKQTPTAAHAYEECMTAGVSISPWSPDVSIHSSEWLVDAIFGIGFKGSLDKTLVPLFSQLQKHPRDNILALDIPSGLNADTGVQALGGLSAGATLTFVAPKLGLFTADGKEAAGDVFYSDLDLSFSLLPEAHLQSIEELRASWTHRRSNTHKRDYGQVLIVGGDIGMAGAVALAAQAAYRVGAGLVVVATRQAHVPIVTSLCPEALCYGIESGEDLTSLLARSEVLALGPGLGQSTWSEHVFNKGMRSSLPKVVDADALRWLARSVERFDLRGSVLTPHPGEAGALLGVSSAEIQTHRFQAVAQLREKYQALVVLKGAGTLIASERLSVCPVGNPGMSSAGMGDILTGTIAGLYAQQKDMPWAAEMGTLIHSRAGDAAAAGGLERGLLASDLLPFLRREVNAR